MTAYAHAPNEAIFSVDALLEDLGNDERALAKTVKMVRDGISPGVSPLNAAGEAVREARFMEARRLVAQLRQSMSPFGAQRLAAACLALELALTSGQVVEIPLLFSKVELELEHVLEQAGAWLDQHAGRNTRR
ncbi:Hpt domain-containing protein [Massilia endophytica]|uniref:Hpt domain-containing protein n=1 Tax=Massilia endophytica TaxID=2899220 RepID=UPI001E62C6BA|nr:Hpt domain-containing protein [Massilia endophytica]UGQ48561.1 Hpt domain-containing protein [Massilia endophytica]